MSTRSQDRPPQGMEPDARKTTQQSMIAAIGASGAVLASGVTTFVLLVGVVSFDVWPMSDSAGLGSGAEPQLVELQPEPAADADLTVADPFGSGVLVTDPATVALAGVPAGRTDRPRLAGKRGVGGDDAPPTPVAQVPGGGGDEDPAGGGDDGDGVIVGAGTEEPIPVEESADDGPDQDDANGRPQRPQRPSRPVPAPAPAPGPVASGAPATSPGNSGSSPGNGAGGSGSSGNGNHGGRG